MCLLKTQTGLGCSWAQTHNTLLCGKERGQPLNPGFVFRCDLDIIFCLLQCLYTGGRMLVPRSK